ncbi:MAG: response regulator [Spirochaetota bacterium]
METPNVLVVDQNDLECKSTCEYLQSFRYEYEITKESRETLATLVTNKYEIVLLELLLPNVEQGLHLLNEINKQNPLIMIIVLSTSTEKQVIIETLSHKKAFDYLSKPATKENLKEAIDKAYHYYYLNHRNNIIQQEERVFEDMLRIFDWKKEINQKYMESLSSSVIHQINIGMLQGEGIGSLTSALSIFLAKAKHVPEDRIYIISEKVVQILRKNHQIVLKLVRSLTEAQKYMMNDSLYTEEHSLGEVFQFFQETKSNLNTMAAIKSQRIKVSDFPQANVAAKITFSFESMKLAMEELLINAMKYSHTDDDIFLLFFATKSHFEIKILNPAYENIDGSVGIQDKNATRVFEPFLRLINAVDESYAKESLKLGMGLTVVRKILQLHNADISIYTIDDNIKGNKKNVCVWIRFPFQ